MCDKDLYPLDFEYFKSLNNLGFKFIIIDGNNRNVTLLQFYGYFQYWNTDGRDSTILANTEAEKKHYITPSEALLPGTGTVIPKGVGLAEKYMDNDTFISYPLAKSSSYEDLPEKIKDIFNSVKVHLTIYHTDQVENLGLIFDNVNSGKTLNEQEIRNSWAIYILTKLIRDFATENYKILDRISGCKWNRRGGDELIAMMHVMETDDLHTEPNQNNMNNIYRKDDRIAWKDTKKDVVVTFKILDALGDKTMRKMKITRCHVLDLFSLVRKLRLQGLQVHDYSGMATWFSVILGAFRNKDSHWYEGHWYTIAREYQWFENFKKGVTDEEPPKYGYEEAVRESNRISGMTQRLERWYTWFCTSFKDNEDKKDSPIGFEFVSYKDPSRIFSAKQKFEAWVRQEGKSLKTGKNIPITELYDETKYQADHIQDHSKSGKTVVENCEIMEIKCHKIKTKETYYGIKGAKIIKSDKNILKKAAKISIPLNSR